MLFACRTGSPVRVFGAETGHPNRGLAKEENMCPACVTTTLALIAAGAGSAGGLTGLVVTKLRPKAGTKKAAPKKGAEEPQTKETPR